LRSQGRVERVAGRRVPDSEERERAGI